VILHGKSEGGKDFNDEESERIADAGVPSDVGIGVRQRVNGHGKNHAE
jgi:hypothetical protein